jgi:predicted regulator of Ras-like GTPase activity (Roadblock/LC7/MglB family)
MSRTEKITGLIKGLTSTTPDLEGAALIDNDGLMIAAALGSDVDEDSMAAMGAALLGLGERIVGELKRGELDMIMLRGTEGLVVLVRAGDNGVLAALASRRAKLGLIFLDVQRTASELANLLG